MVHARDDPVVPVWSLPLAAMASNPHIVTAITRHGGHIGYTAGATPLLGAWTDRVLVHYLRAILAREEEREGRLIWVPAHRPPYRTTATATVPNVRMRGGVGWAGRKTRFFVE